MEQVFVEDGTRGFCQWFIDGVGRCADHTRCERFIEDGEGFAAAGRTVMTAKYSFCLRTRSFHPFFES